MVSESLSRRFRPAGFEHPEGSRKEYVRPRRELQEAFDEWLGGLCEILSEEEYGKACKLVKSLGEISYREANSLLFDFEPKTYIEKEAGLFISACYNQSPEQVIVFDMETPEIWGIGHMLGKNKVLVNNENAYGWFGWNSSGVLVNNGMAGNPFGFGSSAIIVNNGRVGLEFALGYSGIIVNNGMAGNYFGENSSGIMIALKEPEGYGYLGYAKRVLKPEDLERIPELKEYLQELSEITRNIKNEESAKRFLERYGPEPRERREQDIEEILRNGGIEI